MAFVLPPPLVISAASWDTHVFQVLGVPRAGEKPSVGPGRQPEAYNTHAVCVPVGLPAGRYLSIAGSQQGGGCRVLVYQSVH